MDDLEATFAMEGAGAGGSGGGSAMSITPKNPVKSQNITTLLDITRANHVGKWFDQLCITVELLSAECAIILIFDSFSNHAFEDQDGTSRYSQSAA